MNLWRTFWFSMESFIGNYFDGCCRAYVCYCFKEAGRYLCLSLSAFVGLLSKASCKTAPLFTIQCLCVPRWATWLCDVETLYRQLRAAFRAPAGRVSSAVYRRRSTHRYHGILCHPRCHGDVVQSPCCSDARVATLGQLGDTSESPCSARRRPRWPISVSQ